MPLREGEVWGEVTDASLERLLERKGVARSERASMLRINRAADEIDEWRPSSANFYASEETVGRIARGIGDMNPLFHDREYANGSIWRRVLCPPATLCWTEQKNGATEGFPGCHTIWRSVAYTWDRPMLAAEKIGSRTYLTGAHIVEDSSFAGGRAAVQDYETEAFTLDGELIGMYHTSWHRFSRTGAKKASKYAGVERHTWTDDELADVWAEYKRQNLANRRGNEPLYFEDVEEGTEIPHIIKGPITLTSKIAFEMAFGAGGWFVGHELAMQLWEIAPKLPIRNEENVPEPPVAIHWTNERCQRYLGMPGAYEAGFERLNWLGQLLMAWMGDHGMMRALDLQFRAFHWQGDAVRCFGRVTGKRADDGQHLVDLEVSTMSHPRGEQTSIGTATVQLPSRVEGGRVWTPSGTAAGNDR